MADPKVVAPQLPPGRVAIRDRDGTISTVSDKDLAKAINQEGARRATPEETREAKFGGAKGGVVAAALGAADTVTLGGATAALQEAGVAHDGYRGRQNIETQIKGYNETNPVSRALGATAPLLLMPEAGEAALPALGEGAAALARYAAPKLAEGAAQIIIPKMGEGIADDSVNHDLSAQSWWAHQSAPEILFGSVLNLGVAAGVSKLGKSLRGVGQTFGKEGEIAAADARLSEDLIGATQKSGRTSTEANAMFGVVSDLAVQRASDASLAPTIDKITEGAIKFHSKGDEGVAKALRQLYDESSNRFASADRILDETTHEARKASDELMKGVGHMNELQFGLKEEQVSKLIEPAQFIKQADQALTVRNEAVTLLDSIEQRVGTKPAELRKAWDTIGRFDTEFHNSINLNAEGKANEAAAKLYVALDDTKRVFGRFAKFGADAKDENALVAEAIYHRAFRPLLEDEGLWGERLAQMQTRTNATFHDGFTANRAYNSAVGRVIDTPQGKRLWSTEFGKMRSMLSELEHAGADGSFAGLKAEVAQKVIDNTRARAKAIVETMDLAAADTAQLKQTVEAANRLEKSLAKGREDASTFRTLKELKARETQSGSSGILGKVLSFGTSPTRGVRTLGGLRASEAAVRKHIFGEAKAFVTKGGDRVVPTIRPMTAASEKSTVAAMREVRAMAQDPSLMTSKLRAMLGDIPNVKPDVAASIAATASAVILHLGSILPEPLPKRLLDKDQEPRYAPSDIATFDRHLQLSQKPLLLMEKLRTGHIHTDEMVLMDKAFGDLYEMMRVSLLEQIEEGKKNGKLRTLDPHEEQWLSIMLKQPVSDTHRPEFVWAMQDTARRDPTNQAAAGMQAQGGGRPRSVNIDTDRLKTLSEKLEE